MAIQFRHPTAQDRDTWDQFVLENKGTVFHTRAWATIYPSAGFEDTSLLILEDERLVGILPMMSWKRGPFKKGHSVPIGTAGLLSPEAERLTPSLLRKLSESVDALSLTTFQPLSAGSWETWKWIHLDLIGPEEQIFASFSERLRAHIRKGNTTGIEVVEATRDSELADVWNLYCLTMKNRGSGGSYWPGLFPALLAMPADYRRILLARKSGNAVAFNVCVRFGEHAHYFAGGSDPSANKTFANQLLMWENIRWAKKSGSRALQLGGGTQADGSDSLYQYKKKWGSGWRGLSGWLSLSWVGRLANIVERKMGDSWKRRLKSLVLRANSASEKENSHG